MPKAAQARADKLALKLLGEWREKYFRIPKQEGDPVMPAQEFAAGKAAGILFDPIVTDHDQTMNDVIALCRAIPPQQVSNAFLSSLSSRRLDLRAALPSYAVFRHAVCHEATPFPNHMYCTECDFYLGRVREEDLNILNFERFKWGGVRHEQPVYAAFNLGLFRREPEATVTAEDKRIFRGIIEAIEMCPQQTTAAALHKTFADLLPSNKNERDHIVETLGFCGVLETREHSGYFERFISRKDRAFPPRRNVDMAYPARWWTRADGINREALKATFGNAL